jgi:hypothetical protein
VPETDSKDASPKPLSVINLNGVGLGDGVALGAADGAALAAGVVLAAGVALATGVALAAGVGAGCAFATPTPSAMSAHARALVARMTRVGKDPPHISDTRALRHLLR